MSDPTAPRELTPAQLEQQAAELQERIAASRARFDPEMHAQVEQQFRYHAPTSDQIPRYTELRDAARELAHVIVDLCPPCADRTAALRLLRECVMTANASIALEGAL